MKVKESNRGTKQASTTVSKFQKLENDQKKKIINLFTQETFPLTPDAQMMLTKKDLNSSKLSRSDKINFVSFNRLPSPDLVDNFKEILNDTKYKIQWIPLQERQNEDRASKLASDL